MTARTNTPDRSPVAAVFLLSASVLGYEILLLRIFSLTQWHHFAYMVISLALLGFGISGTLLTLVQGRLQAHFDWSFTALTAATGPLAVGCLGIALQLQFHPEELLWRPLQLLRVAGAYLVLSLPFCAAGLAIGLALRHAGPRLGQVYGADLAGAGVGSALVVLLLRVAGPMDALAILAALAIVAAATASIEFRTGSRITLALIVVAALFLMPGARPAMTISPYKSLSRTLLVPGAKTVHHAFGPQGDVRVVSNEKVPFRYAPGLGPRSTVEPPPQLAVFVDGEFDSVIDRYQAGDPRLEYLLQSPDAAGYLLQRPGRVLVLGAGGGASVLRAVLAGAGEIDAVEMNPKIVELGTKHFRDFSGGLFELPKVDNSVRDSRDFITHTESNYQHIDLGLIAPSATGLHALQETYSLTVEAFRLYLRRLTPGGLLSVSSWNQMPPRDGLRLFLTGLTALGQLAVSDPQMQIAMIRGWQTSTLLIKNGVFSPAEVDTLTAFCDRFRFDPVFYPGMPPGRANRYNRFGDGAYWRSAQALAGKERDSFLENYKFDLTPATDDRPYFYHFARMSTLAELFRLRESGGLTLIESGFVVLLATLLLAIVAGIVLILAPLAIMGRSRQTASSRLSAPRILIVFSALGAAFMFIEIGLMQRFTLLLGHPLFAVTVVLASILLFAGVGSLFSSILIARYGQRKTLFAALFVIFATVASYTIAGQGLLTTMAGWPVTARIGVTLVMLAPLALAMGIPFPLALGMLEGSAVNNIPWAWGINGCASVIGATLATLVALEFGIAALLVSGIASYLIAGLCMSVPVQASPLTGHGADIPG